MKEYLDPYSLSIGLNREKKKTHVQLHEKDPAAAHHMNNNKLSRNKNGPQTVYSHVKGGAAVKLSLENVYLSH